MYNERKDGKVVGYDKELVEKTKVNGNDNCILFLNVVDKLNTYIDFYKGTKELFIGNNNLRDYSPLLAKEAYEVGRILASGFYHYDCPDLIKTRIDDIFDEEAKEWGIPKSKYKEIISDYCDRIDHGTTSTKDVYAALASYVTIPETEELRRERMAEHEFDNDPNSFKRLYR